MSFTSSESLQPEMSLIISSELILLGATSDSSVMTFPPSGRIFGTKKASPPDDQILSKVRNMHQATESLSSKLFAICSDGKYCHHWKMVFATATAEAESHVYPSPSDPPRRSLCSAKAVIVRIAAPLFGIPALSFPQGDSNSEPDWRNSPQFRGRFRLNSDQKLSVNGGSRFYQRIVWELIGTSETDSNCFSQ
jgi:hypothetical protein